MKKNWFYAMRAFLAFILSPSISAACLGVALIGLLIGCTTYKGQYDYSVPLNEQSILKIPSELTAVSFDGAPKPWPSGSTEVVVLIPSGEHALVFNYYQKVQTGTTIHGEGTAYATKTTHYVTTTANGLAASSEFLPMHSYTVVIDNDRNMYVAKIIEDTEGSPNDTSAALRGPKYTEAGSLITPDEHSGGYVNWLGIGYLLETGFFVDGKFPWAAYLDIGLGANLIAPSYYEIPIGVYGEIYPLNKGNMGFGLSAGYNIGVGPYIRAAYIPFRKNGKLRGFFELNFLTETSLLDDMSDMSDTPESPIRFGGGIDLMLR
jgi:hypothetical protein